MPLDDQPFHMNSTYRVLETYEETLRIWNPTYKLNGSLCIYGHGAYCGTVITSNAKHIMRNQNALPTRLIFVVRLRIECPRFADDQNGKHLFHS